MNKKIIDLKDYELSGGGKLGESYIKKDNPDILLKLYSTQLEKMGLDEYERANKVYNLGLPCPEPGEQVRTTDGRLGILYKRIHGKLSYARALSYHPELMEQYAVEFAELCKKLHSTVPPAGLFPTIKDQFTNYIKENPFLTDQERSGQRASLTISLQNRRPAEALKRGCERPMPIRETVFSPRSGSIQTSWLRWVMPLRRA